MIKQLNIFSLTYSGAIPERFFIFFLIFLKMYLRLPCLKRHEHCPTKTVSITLDNSTALSLNSNLINNTY